MRTRAIAVAALVLLGLLVPVPDAAAKTLVVNVTNDPVPDGCTLAHCSLREAVIAANKTKQPDKIQLGTPNSFSEIFVLSQAGSGQLGDLDITSSITFTDTLFEEIRGDVGWTDRLFDVTKKGSLKLGFSTLRDGNATVDGADGGSVRNFGRLTLAGVILEDSHANSHGGAIANYGRASFPLGISDVGTISSGGHGGVVYNTGTFSAADAIIESGTAAGTGGAFFNAGRMTLTSRPAFEPTTEAFSGQITGTSAGSGNGAAIANGGSLTVSNIHIHDLAGTGSGSGLYNTGTAVVRNTTIDHAAANGFGAGIFSSKKITISNSTLTQNGATLTGGALHVAGGSASLHHVTISGNSASGGGDGIFVAPGATAKMHASIVEGDFCSGPVTSGGYNVMETSCFAALGRGDEIGVAGLGFLQNNGGPTFTRTIPVAGIAQDQVQNRKLCKGADQRGAPRLAGLGCDAGSYEITICQGGLVDLVGTRRNDFMIMLDSDALPQVALGQGGNDTISTKGGEDKICGGPGNDTLNGGAGNQDILNGGPGRADKCIDADGGTLRFECELQV
jgi:CSLREA domain-containing protein